MNINLKRMMGTVCLFVATAGLVTGQVPITRLEGVTSFVEADGVVSIEAEHYSRRIGAWQSVEGRNAGAGGFGIVPEYRLHARPSPLTPDSAAALEWPQQFPVGWGHPTAAAISALVTDVDKSRSAIFAYEAGAQMHGLVAPARRVGMFSPREAMTGAAWAWVDSAIAWALGGAASGRRAVLVAGSVTPSADDRVLLARMRALGLAVRTLEHTAELDARAYPELFIISESVHPDRVAARFRDVPVPVIVMKAFVYDRMGMVQSSPASWAGNAMMIADGRWTDRLGYHVYFTHPGNYLLWLLGRDGGDAGSDEVKVFFDTEQIDARSVDFFEMRLPREPGWSNVAHVRRPDNRKTPAAPVLRVNRIGWHTLWLVKGAEPEAHSGESPMTRRYPNWRIDKIALFKAPSRIPAGDGPPETRNQGTVAVPSALQQRSTAAAEPYVLDGRFLVIEAEALRPHAHWRLLREPAGFSGEGYLEWNGPNRSRSIEGVGGSDDLWHTQQGPLEEWLLLHVRVREAGDYVIDLRNHHRRVDGDNDAWIGTVEAGWPRRPVKRVGDSLRDGPGFSWLDWGTPTLHLTAGEHVLYVGGRSRGFGVDRIAIYKADSDEARARALDPATPAARPVTAR